MKPCPLCREEIQDDVIKCRHCQSVLVPGLAASPAEAKPAPSGKVTYVVDEGLVRFAKFAAAVLGLFVGTDAPKLSEALFDRAVRVSSSYGA